VICFIGTSVISLGINNLADIYQHDAKKFSDAGLQLRTPPDLIPPNQYSKLTNVIPAIEGRLETRAAIAFIVNLMYPTEPGSGLHSLVRLNQHATSAVGDRIAGVDTTVQTLALPSGSVPITRDTSRTGDPLSMPNFHFSADPPSWQIIADRAGMRKYRGGTGAGYYLPLGILPPSRSLAQGGIIGAAASAAIGGAGNLSGGATAGQVVARPTTKLNGWGVNGHVGAYELGVDQGFGFGLNGPASPYSNPQNAFDGDETTAASIVMLHTHTYAGCVWSFAFTGSVTVGLSLNVLSEVPVPGPFGVSPSGWLRSAGIWYSLDSGTTWTQVYNSSTRTKQWDNIPLPSGQDLNQVQVMAFTDAHDDMAHNVFEINIAPSIAPGPGYDWVYTYVNEITQTESNPSITNWGTQFEQTFPQTITTPDPSFGGSAASSTFGGGGASPVGANLSADSGTETRQSVLFSNWTAATQQYSALYFEIQMSATVSGGNLGGCVYWAVYFSLDAGNSWNLAIDGNTSVDYGATDLQPSFLLFLNPTQNLSKLQLRAVVLGVGDTTDPQNVTARRVRDRAGNLNVSDLLTGGGGNMSVSLAITDIKTSGVFLTATPKTLSLASQQAQVTVINPFDPQVTAFRLYRRGGTVTASWAFVKQYPVTAHDGLTSVLTDNVADTNLGSFVNLINDAPVTSVYAQNRVLPYIWGPAFNPTRLFGCGDPDRPGAVYFSNPGNADQWANGQWIDVSSPSDPMQNGCVFNTRNFAFSKERMFEVTPSLVGGGSFVPFETPCRRGLISPWGLLPTARAVYFVAKDGIYATTGGQEQSLVENDIKPLFPTLDGPGRSVEGYEAVNLERIEDIRLRYHNDELYFIYRGMASGELQMLVYDQNKGRWRAASFPIDIVTIYSEEAGPASSLLLGDEDGSLYSTVVGAADVWLMNAGAGPPPAPPPTITITPISAIVQTGAFDQGLPLNLKEYANVIVDLDPGGATLANPVTITPLLNAETITDAAITVTGSGRQQVPLPLGDVFGFNIEFLINFVRTVTINPVIYQFDILWRPEPVSVTHWETRESSYGMPGYGHVRDSYVAIRSTAPVILTMTFDGTAQTYTIPSTGGQRRKMYVPSFANKGKVYKFSFDAADGVTAFRLYVEDCELRIKPFVTSLGYQVIKAWGAESQLVTAAYESMLLGGGR
jgi:hypothetical protein